MRKKYIKPVAMVFQAEPTAILAGSGDSTKQIELGGSGKHRAKEFFFEEDEYEYEDAYE